NQLSFKLFHLFNVLKQNADALYAIDSHSRSTENTLFFQCFFEFPDPEKVSVAIRREGWDCHPSKEDLDQCF
ncbi:MAG: hypothetical protein AAFS13_09820, partial [Pseudomonadota bacterium]